MKFCCFRFDVDTHACVVRGMPRLLDLAENLGLRFTFFVNMGRGFNPAVTIGNAFHRLRNRPDGPRLPAAAKLGLLDSCIAATLNPRAGDIRPGILRAAQAAGHELGLHGGRNHANWQNGAHRWSVSRLRCEVAAGLHAMRRHRLTPPISFASPAWNGPALLQELLPEFGFRILADTYDTAWETPQWTSCGLALVPTNITPGQGNAGYIESLRLRGFSDNEILSHFQTQLHSRHRLAVVYEHPFYAGVQEIPLLREMAACAVASGFHLCCIKDAVLGKEVAA